MTSWQGYDIGGYSFYTNSKDRKSSAQNSGVRVVALDATGQNKSYYGIIQEIWELDYGLNIQIPVLRCQWVKDIMVDKFGFTCAERSKIGHKDDPWVLAERVAQVFYVKDPSDDKMDIIVSGNQNIIGMDNIQDASDYNQYDAIELFTDLPTRMKRIESVLDESKFASVRKDVNPKIVKR